VAGGQATAKPAAEVAAPVTGQIAVTTQPPGAKVLLDGKAVGTTPMTLPDITPGRHTIIAMGNDGTVRRTVKVDAGQLANVDISIFSGFVEISAPIVVKVSEGGRVLGTSENQIMLSPGHHELRLANTDLNYGSTLGVDIEPGEGRQIQLDPKGTANINAQPWAEVWIDGSNVGETPLANLPITLGVHEIVLKNPQYGERKITTTVVAGTASTIAVDFTKQ
jgi:hypothetical protein